MRIVEGVKSSGKTDRRPKEDRKKHIQAHTASSQSMNVLLDPVSRSLGSSLDRLFGNSFDCGAPISDTAGGARIVAPPSQ